ncbi:hypothetical protein CBL_08107 [Carabus blaptoides fortunei]
MLSKAITPHLSVHPESDVIRFEHSEPIAKVSTSEHEERQNELRETWMRGVCLKGRKKQKKGDTNVTFLFQPGEAPKIHARIATEKRTTRHLAGRNWVALTAPATADQ